MDFGDIYVYPNGGCASVALRILKDLTNIENVRYIDDSDDKTSLKTLKQEILASDLPVLLLGGDCYSTLEEKCKKEGIEYINGIALCAKLLSTSLVAGGGEKFTLTDNILFVFNTPLLEHAYMFHNFFLAYTNTSDMEFFLESLKKYCQNIVENSLVCEFLHNTLLVSFSRDFLSITQNFPQNTPLLWYFGSLEWYEKNKNHISKDSKVVICNWVLLDYFIYKTALLGGGILPKLRDNKRNIYGIGHTMVESLHYASMRDRKEFLDRRVYSAFCAFSHYIAINKDSKRAFEAMFESVNLDIEIVEGGYPRFDNRFKKRDVFHFNKEQFLFIPRLSKPHELIGIIGYLLQKGKKVIFRKHGAYKNYIEWQGADDPYKLLEIFNKDSNFSFDESPSITNEILEKSIVITDNSSVAYSAPLLSLTPCILYSTPKNEFDLRVKNYDISFSNPLLHRLALNEDEFYKVALDLEYELKNNGEKIAKEIQDYVLDNFYNLGFSAEVIAKTLLESFEK